jgi:hypothetical protein
LPAVAAGDPEIGPEVAKEVPSFWGLRPKDQALDAQGPPALP